MLINYHDVFAFCLARLFSFWLATKLVESNSNWKLVETLTYSESEGMEALRMFTIIGTTRKGFSTVLGEQHDYSFNVKITTSLSI